MSFLGWQDEAPRRGHLGQLNALGSAWSYLHAFIPKPVISLEKHNFERISKSYSLSRKVQRKKKIPQMERIAEPVTSDTSSYNRCSGPALAPGSQGHP